jgi:hypothetical protein
LQDKEDADCQLLHNIYILIQEREGMRFEEHLTTLRYQRAENYYEMVLIGGKGAFNKSKSNVA